jgi:hypothetical protein
MQDVDTIHRKFLKNVARQTKPGFQMCVAIPAWRAMQSSVISHQSSDQSSITDDRRQTTFHHLKVLDSLEEMGYTRMSFAHVSNDQLIYHRPDQIVARELVVLQRI